MLSKFAVTNFRNFENTLELDLTKVRNYEYNARTVENGIVKKGIVYGANGVGKSNFGIALFDIVRNITENNPGTDKNVNNFLNLDGDTPFATFLYEFKFDEEIIAYKYSKASIDDILSEEVAINGEVIVRYTKGENLFCTLPGTENLNKDLRDSKISAIRYIRNNSIRQTDKSNIILGKFFEFVDNMLFFKSVEGARYIGFTTGINPLFPEIIKNGKISELQNVLNSIGVELQLVEYESEGAPSIGVKFKSGKILPINSVYSTGTFSLILYFYWLQFESKISFLFIDEFDAFYHHELSKFVVGKLLENNIQCILTTHNISLMGAGLVRPDSCFVLRANRILALSDLTDKELRQAHNLEKMYVAGAFD